MHQRKEKEGVVILIHDLCNSPPKVWNGSENRKEGVVILSHFDKIYVTHLLKLGMDQRKEKEGVVILSHFDMHVYVTHHLKLGTDQRREKEGVVILSHFDMHVYVTHHLSWERIREEKKREWLFLVILARSMQLTR